MINIKNKVEVIGNNEFTPIPDGEVSFPIPFDPELIFQKNQAYAIDTAGNKLAATNLADHSTINNVAGAPTGVPANGGLYVLNLNGYTGFTWYNVQGFRVLFDLNDIYNLDYAYIWMDEGQNAPISLWGSSDGVELKPLSLNITQLTKNQWNKIDFSEVSKGGNRYLVLALYGADIGVRALVLYGRPSLGIRINRGQKLRRKIVRRKFNESVGTNGFYIEHPELMSTVSQLNRFYVEPDWFLGDLFRQRAGAVGLTPDDLTFKFSNSHFRNNDAVLQAFANEGAKVIFTVTTSPVCLRYIETPDSSHVKPVDPNLNYLDLNVTTNPMNYTFMARIAWNISARYGSNKNIDLSLINLQPESNSDPKTQQVKVGMKLIEALELGNEMDKWWLGQAAYNNPHELAAYMSAIYDGHMGAMGPGYGVKHADPSMKVSIPGLAAGEDIAYVREMMLWCDKYRGKGNYPWDIINYHYYNSSEGSQFSGIDSAHGLPPEQGRLMEVNRKWSDLRDIYCQSAEVWLTETGWDEHLGGVFSPQYPTQKLRSLYKAEWLTRMYAVNEATGVDATNQYWYASQGGQKLEDLDTGEPNRGQFLSQALVEGVNSSDDINRKPLVSYWYVATIRKLLTNYKFKHIMVEKGVRNTTETIIQSNDSTIWALAYENELTNERLVVAWLDSASRRTLNVGMLLAENEVIVDIIAGAEIRGVADNPVLNNIKYPILNPLRETLLKENGVVNLTLTECPCVVYTNTLGTKKLIQPTNIKTQTINSSNILVTWKDSNLERVDTRISYSTNPNSGFILAYQGEISTAEYVIQNLFVGPTYFVRVEILPLGSDIPDPEVPDFDTNLSPAEATASGVWYAATTTKYGTSSPAVNGDKVGSFIDKVNNYDMNFVGWGPDHVPPLPILDGPPELDTISLDIPYVKMWNLPHLGYESVDFPAQTGVPYVIGFVLELHKYAGYETLIPGSAGYISILDPVFRIGQTTWEVPGTALTYFKRTFVQVEFKETEINVYHDGVLKGTRANDLSLSDSDKRKKIALFVDTNNAAWNFFSLYDWRGANYNALMADFSNIASVIMEKFNCGQMNPKPYASSLTASFNTTTRVWTANMVAENATQDQIDNATYMWMIKGDPIPGDGGNFANQRPMLSTGKTLNESEYLSLPPADRREVVPYVSIGGYNFLKGEGKNL